MIAQNNIAVWNYILCFFVLILVFVPIPQSFLISAANAQDNCKTALEEAQEAYDANHYDVVVRLLNACLPNGIAERTRMRAYKLLAVAYTFENQPDKAKTAIREFLSLNPGYEPDTSQDPPLFVKLLREVKQEIIERGLTKRPSKKKWLWIGVGGGGLVAGVITAVIINREEGRPPRLPDPPALP